MEYRLIVGCVEKQSAQSVGMGSSKMINENDRYNGMPIRVEIKRP
jgi:hypothetical protein